MYERAWYGYFIAHIGTQLYKINSSTGAATSILSGLTAQAGVFFVFDDGLYYHNRQEYVRITASHIASAVTPYIPITVVNVHPDGTGGSLYQSENRLSAGKRVYFNADGVSTEYHLPYAPLDNSSTVGISIRGVAQTEGTDFIVNRTTGIITFATAPTDEEDVNAVQVTCYKTNQDALDSVMKCRALAVYGSGNDTVVVLGGTPKQPNAIFWSGSHSVLDPTYFPMEYYNLVGSADEYVTGFGKQQDLLLVFKEHSVGKTSITVSTTDDDETVIQLNYQTINARIGCDLPNTIQLVSNNLVFCNSTSGVHMVLDTSAAGENNIAQIGTNINNAFIPAAKLLSDKSAICSFDDGKRYWICFTDSGKCYLWDYSISLYSGDETNLTWFYFTGVHPVSWLLSVRDSYHLSKRGDVVKLTPSNFSDFGAGYKRKFTFATQTFGTYDSLKDILKVIIAMRADTGSRATLKYVTDYEKRYDLTPLASPFSYSLVPRNLESRNLGVDEAAGISVRKPGCFHVRRFAMVLENDTANTDMAVVSAQIQYRFVGGDR